MTDLLERRREEGGAENDEPKTTSRERRAEKNVMKARETESGELPRI
jgi:hypothetical protein